MRTTMLRLGMLVTVLALVIGTAETTLLKSGSAPPRTAPNAAAAPAPAAAEGLSDRAVLDRFSTACESAARHVDPAVVAIFTEAETQVSTALPEGAFPFDFGGELGRFFRLQPGSPDQTMIRRGLGSGVIVRSDGYILTNNHVIDGATKLVVRLNDKREVPATVVGTDPQSDLAVIRIDEKDLPVATLGESGSLEVGQWVIAVGNPLEMLHTVTAGIVSATGRSSVGVSVYEDFIQTDASINPGNSGGALADLDGRVVGINTAIASPTGSSVGIGFAIPIDRARRVMDELIASGRVVRGYLALLPQDVDPSLARALHLDSTRGALVADVTPEGPAARAGLEPGDVIVDYAGRPVEDAAQLRNLVAESRPGSRVEVSLVREGREKKVTVDLAQRPDPENVAALDSGHGGSPGAAHGKLGLGVETLTPELAQRLGVPAGHGVVVERVAPGSPADRAGLRPGDVIAEVGSKPVESARDFAGRVGDARPGEPLALRVRRGEGAFYTTIEPAAG